MKIPHRSAAGFSLVELMIAMAIGLFLIGATTAVFIAQSALSRSTVSQAEIQNAENAIGALVTPTLRGAGFTGCSSLGEIVSTLNSGGPAPLSSVSSASQMAMLAGYDASGTGGSGTVTLSQGNAANASSTGSWSPVLDATLTGKAQGDSDVLIALGALPDFNPIGVTAVSNASTTALTVQNIAGLAAGQYAAVTDCAKTNIFQITDVTGTTVSHAAGNGSLSNTSDYLPVPFSLASQLVALQLTAFYVAHGTGDQSVLMRATYQNGVWTETPLVPGVDNLQVLYGIGDGTTITSYIPASSVSDWTKVDAVRLGFLIEGEKGTGPLATAQNFSVLGTTVAVPNDGRLRHVYEMTVNLRNAS